MRHESTTEATEYNQHVAEVFNHPKEHETECLKLHRDCIKRMETMPVEMKLT